MYEYYLEIRWKIENNDSKDKIFAINKRIKRL